MYSPVYYSPNKVHVFDVDCFLPEQPETHMIAGWDRPKKEQYWRRNPLPRLKTTEIEWFSGERPTGTDIYIPWDVARREEAIKQTGKDPWRLNRYKEPMDVPGVEANPDYVSRPLYVFRKQEIERCHPWPVDDKGERVNHGYWFFNKGKPVWITPFNYFFLNWWRMDSGYPDYIDIVRKFYYAWQWAFEHPIMLGVTMATKRGSGKSYMGGAGGYQVTIYSRRVHTGMQTKPGETDHQDLFVVHVAQPYKALPDFFVPINSNPSEPTSGLKFSAPSKRGKQKEAKPTNKKPLDSWMDFQSAKFNAYDRTTLAFLLRDEEGKCRPAIVDVNERHNVTINCVWRHNRKRGAIWSTTTVEESSNGGREYRKLYENSDMRRYDKMLKRTPSRLLKIFLPTQDLINYDKHGQVDVDENLRIINREKEQLHGDPQALLQYTLMNPTTETDLFRTTAQKCPYNLEILQAVEEKYINNVTVREKTISVGNFIWPDGFGRGNVVWEENNLNGMWQISWRFLKEKQESNAWERRMVGGEWGYVPLNDERFCGGFDPTKSHSNEKQRSSNAAGTIFRKEVDPFGEFGQTFVADFLYLAPSDPDDAWFQFATGCFYFGCKFLPENVLGVSRIMKEYRLWEFIMPNPWAAPGKVEPGLPSSNKHNDDLVQLFRSHVHHHGYKLKHPRIIENAIEFDPGERTKFDMHVASQLSVAASKWEPPARLPEIDGAELYTSYDHNGLWSKTS